MAKPRKPRINPVTVYLGDDPIRTERKERLDAIAKGLGLGDQSRSKLIQMIADGDLLVVPKPKGHLKLY